MTETTKCKVCKELCISEIVNKSGICSECRENTFYNKYIRKCAKCAKHLKLVNNNKEQEGYTDEVECYCSPDCLQLDYPEYDRNAEVDDNSEFYYTTWELEENE